MRQQHLDPNNVDHGVMLPLFGGNASRNVELGAALCSAVNDWQIAEFVSREPRLRASIQIPHEDPAAAVAEIERNAGNPGFAQILLSSSSSEPLGRKRRYGRSSRRRSAPACRSASTWAAPRPRPDRRRLAVLLRRGALRPDPRDAGASHQHGAGRCIRAVSGRAGGAGRGRLRRAPSLGWRLDRLWSRMRDEVPHAKRPPSEYMRENLYYTTQPMEEPGEPDEILLTFEQIGWDRLLFATDYPHWDFDDPRHAFKIPLPEGRRRMLFRGNAAQLYGLA